MPRHVAVHPGFAGVAGRTTLVILNEFGRDPDGCSTNGFFNHRTNTETCRLAWAMVLGPAAGTPG